MDPEQGIGTAENFRANATNEASVVFNNLQNQWMQLFREIRNDIEDAIEDNNRANREVNTELKNTLDSINRNFASWVHGVDAFVDSVEKIAYNMNGTTQDVYTMATQLSNVLGASSLVSQKAVYEKLSSLILSGITYNSAQRAFLATLADDIGAQFSSYVGTLNNITRLYGEDVTARGLAMETSMKSYLTTAYNNSEYLVQQFSTVLSNFSDAMSWMSTDEAFSTEASIQKWLGSFYSVGGSSQTVSGLSSALNALGSGNINSMSSNQYLNLILMAASRAGLSYADILINGLTEETTDILMNSLFKYMASLGDANGVVRSELARIFGVTVTDIKAASSQALQEIDIVSTKVSTNIYETLFKNLEGYIPETKMISNSLSNFSYSMMVGLATSPAMYTIYKIADLANNITDSFGLSEFEIGGVSIENILGLVKLGTVVSGGAKGLLSILKSFNVNSQQEILDELHATGSTGTAIGRYYDSLFYKENTNSSLDNGLNTLFQGLGTVLSNDYGVTSRGRLGFSGLENSSVYKLSTVGQSASGSSSGGLVQNTSKSLNVSNVSGSNFESAYEQAIGTIEPETSLDDVIAAINDLAGVTYASTVKINSEGNSVTLVDGERNSLERYTMTSAIYTVNIYELLKAAFSGGQITSISTTTYNLDEYLEGLKEQTSVTI
jgi:hypothetical protein